MDQLESDAKSIASDLIGHIQQDQERAWLQGTVSDWAMESFQLGKKDAYGQLPQPSAHGSYWLNDDYVVVRL